MQRGFPGREEAPPAANRALVRCEPRTVAAVAASALLALLVTVSVASRTRGRGTAAFVQAAAGRWR